MLEPVLCNPIIMSIMIVVACIAGRIIFRVTVQVLCVNGRGGAYYGACSGRCYFLSVDFKN